MDTVCVSIVGETVKLYQYVYITDGSNILGVRLIHVQSTAAASGLARNMQV